MQLKLLNSKEVPTLATNGKELFWNSDFLKEQSEEHTRFGLAHEVMHVILNHCVPHPGKDHQLCNVAMDYVINAQLVNAGFSMIPGVIYDPTHKFDDMAWEEVYKILEDINKGNTDKAKGKGFDDSDISKIKSDIENATDHIQPNESLTDSEAQEMSDFIDDMIIRANNAQESSGKGEVPSAVKQRIKAIRSNQVDWTEQLHNNVKSRYPEDLSFSRPNRRHISSGMYLPSMIGTKAGPLAIAVDTSGSVSKEELTAFVAEVNSIINDIKPEKVYLMSADSHVADVQEFEEGHYFEDFNSVGGGGTSFRPVFEHIDKNNIEIDQLVYFSDMYVWDDDFPSKEPHFPVTWVSSGEERKVPFGELIKIKLAA